MSTDNEDKLRLIDNNSVIVNSDHTSMKTIDKKSSTNHFYAVRRGWNPGNYINLFQ